MVTCRYWILKHNGKSYVWVVGCDSGFFWTRDIQDLPVSLNGIIRVSSQSGTMTTMVNLMMMEGVRASILHCLQTNDALRHSPCICM